jgi:hypothetical protein
MVRERLCLERFKVPAPMADDNFMFGRTGLGGIGSSDVQGDMNNECHRNGVFPRITYLQVRQSEG